MSDLITMMSAAAGQGGINPRKHFNTVLYTGDRTDRTITVGFQPDLVWVKSRNQADNHYLMNSLSGVGKYLSSNLTAAEATNAATLTAFDSTGFSVGNTGTTNETGRTYASWSWKGGGTGVSNTDGTITSTVSANTTAGISIITYTGNGTAGATVGHGLGVVPKMVIIKRRDNTGWWLVFTDLTTQSSGSVYTSSVFNIGDKSGGVLGLNVTNATFSYTMDGQTNASGGTYVALVFSEVEGFSKFGSYTGNGSATGPSVTTGFLPSFLMIKRTNSTGDWIIHDSARDASNPRTEYLEPNTSDAEATGNDVDFNSTGFQLKSTSATINASGGTYIYACFA